MFINGVENLIVVVKRYHTWGRLYQTGFGNAMPSHSYYNNRTEYSEACIWLSIKDRCNAHTEINFRKPRSIIFGLYFLWNGIVYSFHSAFRHEADIEAPILFGCFFELKEGLPYIIGMSPPVQ